MTFDIGLHEVCVRTGVRYVITKFSGMDSLPNFLTHGAPLRALRARGSSAISLVVSVRTINYGTSVRNLQYGPKTRIIRGIYILIILNSAKTVYIF